MTRKHDARRRLRVGAYAMYTAAGPFAILFTPPVIRESVGTMAATMWGAYILVGGLGCLLGALTDRWLGEYVFLHLLGSAVALYALAAFAAADADLGRIVSGVLVLGTSLLMADRWFDVKAVARVSMGGPCPPGRE